MKEQEKRFIHDCPRDEPPLNWTHEVACLIHQYDTLEKCPIGCPYRKENREMEQQGLFGTDPKKLVRREGPDTSQAAAMSVDTSRLEEIVYQTILKFYDGCISDQVRDEHPHLSYSSITARYKALMDKGLIYDTGKRRQGKSGRMQRVMRATIYRRNDE